MVLPLIISVAMEEEAMALPQPKVSNFTSLMHVVLDLQVHLHDVAALGVADLADAVGVLDLTHVPGMREMVHDFFAIQCHN